MPDPSGGSEHRGTHRARTVEDTWAWLAPQLARYGVTRVADVTGLDEIGVPVAVAVRPAARTLSVSQGKGLTRALARVSAAMEAVELWHAEHLPPETTAVPARRLGRLPYDGDELAGVRRPFWHEDLPVDWVTAEGLLSGDRVPVPWECVALDASFRPSWSPPVFRPSSNGLAGGNTLAEATVHALCEVAERDTTALLAEAPPAERSRLSAGTVTDPDCRELLDRFAAAGVAVAAYHSRGRVGLHTFDVVGMAETVPLRFAGAGCHPDPAVALARALTEAAQSRLTAIAGSRDDDEEPVRAAGRWQAPAAAPAGRPLRWDALTGTAQSTLDGELAGVGAAIAAATGREPLRVTLPSPTGVPVVRVVAPGLRISATATTAGGTAR